MEKKQLADLLRSEHLDKLPQWYCDMNCFREPVGFPMPFKRVADDREAFRDPDRRMAFEAVTEILGPEGTSCAWWLLELGKTREEWIAWWAARNGAIADTENEMDTKTVWVAGKHRGSTESGQAWDLQGVFDSEALADAACKAPEDFIGPVQLNAELPQDAISWPGIRFPRGDVDA